jgi:hypothetical protein
VISVIGVAEPLELPNDEQIGPALKRTVERERRERVSLTRTGQPDTSGWRFWPKHQSALPLSLDSRSMRTANGWRTGERVSLGERCERANGERANGRTGQPDTSGWLFWPKHQSALPLSLDSRSRPDFYPYSAGPGLSTRDRLHPIPFLEAPSPPNPLKTLLEHPQVPILAKRQRSEIIENLQSGRALCHLGLNNQPLVSG